MCVKTIKTTLIFNDKGEIDLEYEAGKPLQWSREGELQTVKKQRSRVKIAGSKQTKSLTKRERLSCCSSKPQLELSDAPVSEGFLSAERRQVYATRSKTRHVEILEELNDMALRHGRIAAENEKDKVIAEKNDAEIWKP
ncbi:hypothetical protein HBH53_036240 [Parastagonospora nodorum]|nr:hypothetical protein HBH53_036240 [Parastagonospora nodorum]KAH4036829.1 hypothetical protein HBI09_077980 [Parastagonospora nodorum]KAH4223743.1 hypothetical protein HBI06_125050 [Parastagonospora nodorum]KAH4241632.1 hypothetical protein HBI05_098930 [Parastagonospora nodorum]KAH5015616.1 hypothetical protein HBI77_059850 [Parastagonospora nodorum]